MNHLAAMRGARPARLRSVVAAEQANEEAQLRHGEAPGAGGHCIPRGWGARGRGEAPRRLLRSSRAGRRLHPAGWGPYGPGRGVRGAERAGASRRSGHGRRQARRTGAPPELVFSACTAGGYAGLWGRRAPGASPAFSSRSGRGRAHGSPGTALPTLPGTRGDEAEAAGVSPAPRRTVGRQRAARPLRAPLPSEAGASPPATSRPDPGAPGSVPLQRRVRGACLGEGSSSSTC